MPSRREFPKRRAVNQIWNGAGEYGFAPDFVAFASGGVPDLYLNTCVGLVRKWYDAEQLRLLFADFQRFKRQRLYNRKRREVCLISI